MSDLFSFVQGEDDIWYVQFDNLSREAVIDYIETITTLNRKIISGEINTHNPLRVLWDFTEKPLPQLQTIALQAKMNPPPPELGYKIAYLVSDTIKKAELEAFRAYFKTDNIDRKIFFETQRAQAISWLLEASVC